MRNNFEHIEERLDRRWRESRNHIHGDLNIGPSSMFGNLDEIDRFRLFDPKTKDVTFWGDSFNPQVVVTEVARILPKVSEEAVTPH